MPPLKSTAENYGRSGLGIAPRLLRMREWLSLAGDRLAASLGDKPSVYELTDEDVERLLDLARIAARDSGDRTNAPLICYLLGLAHARHQKRTMNDLVEQVTAGS